MKNKENAQRNQLIADTIPAVPLVTASINIIKGFPNIQLLVTFGYSAVWGVIGFLQKQNQAFAATKLHTGAKRIDDHFGFVDRYGDTDLHGGQRLQGSKCTYWKRYKRKNFR